MPKKGSVEDMEARTLHHELATAKSKESTMKRRLEIAINNKPWMLRELCDKLDFLEKREQREQENPGIAKRVERPLVWAEAYTKYMTTLAMLLKVLVQSICRKTYSEGNCKRMCKPGQPIASKELYAKHVELITDRLSDIVLAKDERDLDTQIALCKAAAHYERLVDLIPDEADLDDADGIYKFKDERENEDGGVWVTIRFGEPDWRRVPIIFTGELYFEKNYSRADSMLREKGGKGCIRCSTLWAPYAKAKQQCGRRPDDEDDGADAPGSACAIVEQEEDHGAFWDSLGNASDIESDDVVNSAATKQNCPTAFGSKKETSKGPPEESPRKGTSDAPPRVQTPPTTGRKPCLQLPSGGARLALNKKRSFDKVDDCPEVTTTDVDEDRQPKVASMEVPSVAFDARPKAIAADSGVGADQSKLAKSICKTSEPAGVTAHPTGKAVPKTASLQGSGSISQTKPQQPAKAESKGQAKTSQAQKLDDMEKLAGKPAASTQKNPLAIFGISSRKLSAAEAMEFEFSLPKKKQATTDAAPGPVQK